MNLDIFGIIKGIWDGIFVAELYVFILDCELAL